MNVSMMLGAIYYQMDYFPRIFHFEGLKARCTHGLKIIHIVLRWRVEESLF